MRSWRSLRKTFKRGLVLFVVYITAYALFTIARGVSMAQKK